MWAVVGRLALTVFARLCHTRSMLANPDVLVAINDPAVVDAVTSVLGEAWAIVPYANSLIEADNGDQHWYCKSANVQTRCALNLALEYCLATSRPTHWKY